MFRNLMIFIAGILMIGLIGCNLKTPEIRGVVLDAESKQPVEGAWITATLEVYSKTVGGEVHHSFFVGKTWTDKEGKFSISPRKVEMPSFPLSLKNKVESLNIAARAVTSNGYISDGKGIKDGKQKFEITMNLKPPQDNLYYRSALGGLYDYILSGRIGDSVPPVLKTERLEVLNIAIGAYTHFLDKMGEPKTSVQKTYYTAAMKDLGYLYLWKEDYKKALIAFKEVMEFDRNRNMDLYIKEYEDRIREIQQKIQGKQQK